MIIMDGITAKKSQRCECGQTLSIQVGLNGSYLKCYKCGNTYTITESEEYGH